MKRTISTMACCLTLMVFAAPTLAQRTAEDYVKASKAFLQNRDLDGAIAALDKAIELKADFAEAYIQRHRLHVMKGALDPALADINKALLIDPEIKQAYAERAHIRMLKNDVKGALSDFDNAIVKGYRSDSVYAQRATMRTMIRDFEGAISDFNIAISMSPGRIGHYLGRGSARSAAGDDDGALADYNYILEKFEEKERERLAAGKSERRAAPFDLTSPEIEGPEHSSAKQEISPPGKPVREVTRTGATVSMKVDTGPGMTIEKMEYLPNIAGAYLNRGTIYAKRGDSDAALADLTKSITIHPFFGTYHQRAREFLKRGDLSAAIADFTKAIELQPRFAFFYLERGVALLLLGRDDEAEKDFARCLELDPKLKPTLETRRAETTAKREKKLQ